MHKISFTAQAILTIVFFIITPTLAWAQISGPTTVFVGNTETYTFDNGAVYVRKNWQVQYGTIVSSTSSGTTYTCTVTWNTCTSGGYLEFRDFNTQISVLTVNIVGFTPTVPATTFSTTQNCRSSVITRNTNPPSAVEWYWQTSASGTDLTNSSSTFTVTSSGLFYLRAYCCGIWSPSSQMTSHVLVVNPSAPATTPAARCGPGAVTLTGSVSGTGGDNINWYTASSGGTLLGSGLSFVLSNVTATTTYYASSLHTSLSCESLTRTPIVVTINPGPQITNTTAQLNVESCSTTALNFTPTSSMGGTTYSWTSSASAGITGHTSGNGAITNTLTNASTTATGTATYVITPTADGCNGPTKNYVVTVLPKPVISLPGSQALIYGAPAPVLSTNTPAAAYAWKFNGSNISGATSSSYTVALIGAYSVGVKYTASSPECISSNYTSQPYPVNYVSTTRILKEGVTPASSLYSLTPAEVSQTIAFQDGIGRTFQVVGVGQSPQQTDVISPIALSKQGTVDTTFLPYVSSTKDGRFKINAIRNASGAYAGSEQQMFYQSTAQVQPDANPYARTISRTTPDGRVIEQGAPGAAWQPGGGTPHTVRNTIVVNTTSYPVRLWKTDGTTTGNYPAKTVAVSITTDENGNQVRTFTNKLGQTVLKQVQIDKTIETVVTPWLETYYIYDNFGRVVCQLPPKAMKVLGTGASLNAYNATVAELVYRYVYDAKGRLVEKKVPGAAWEYIIYDNLDRVVLTQDGNLRASNTWMFVKYDYQNRPVYSGLYVNATQTTRVAVQGLFDPIDYGSNPRFEIEQVNATYQGYSNSVFPTGGLTVLAANYYDHYDFNRDGTADYTYDNAHLSGIPAVENKLTRGLPTGGKRVTIDANGAATGNWLISATFYDQYERPVQVRSNNHLNLTISDKASILYDFVRATKSKTTHTGPTTVNITRRYTFDHAGRVSGVYQTIDALPEQQLASYTYNPLGQLIDKKLHITGGSTYLQSIDYRYNIRGWLTSINNAQMSNDGTLNDDTGDYFGMELAYNTAAGMSNTPYYNGNISAVKWKAQGTGTTGVTDQRSYKYLYDKSDKLETATFQANTGSAWTKEAGTLNENMGYDHNGNILALSRNHNLRGLSGTTVTNTTQTIDNLTYTYRSGNQNQIEKVEDAALPAGFKNGAVNGTDEYTYSSDGSLNKDNNKGISTILYNALGKPRQITFTDGRSVAYTYAADGSKLKMAATVSGVTTTTDYAGGFVYTNNALSFFGSPEGRVVKNGSTYEQQYAIADHQGNTRVLFSSVTPAPYVPQATWEGDANDNASHYSNVVVGNVVSNVAANHTSGGSKVVRMNQTYKIGPAKSLAVYAGDKVDLEVWEYHEGNSGFGTTSTPIATLITNVAGAFGGVSGAPDVSGSIYNGVNSAITGFGTGGNQGNTRPAAYLNYILFDKNYKVLNAGWQLAPATTFTKQKLLFSTIDVKEAGFIFVWLSYDDDSNNWVYFDDLKVTHTKNNIIQYNEYYPFGMQTAASWTRENVTGNNFLANGGTELNATSSLYDLDYRNYDPVLGRMHQVDPMAGKYSSLTPYNFSFNDPVAFTDRNGADPMPGEPDHVASWERYRGRAVVNNQRVYDRLMGGHITPGSGGNWADGIQFSDWSPHGGSDMFRGGLAAGLTEIGGNLYQTGPGRSRTEAREENGQLHVSGTGMIWNPWAGAEVGPGKYKGSWTKFSFSLLHKIAAKRYQIRTLIIGGLAQQTPGGDGERADLSSYRKRGENIGWDDLLVEYKTGLGPERSVFYQDHPVVQDMRNSYIVREAKRVFEQGGGKAIHFEDIDFQWWNVPIAGYNMTEQFFGSARVSIIPNKDGRIMYQIDNTTDRNSASFDKSTPSIPRASGQLTPNGTIYQRLIWWE